MDIRDYQVLQNYLNLHEGVLSIGDIINSFGKNYLEQTYRQIRCLEEAGVLRRFARGIYVGKKFNLERVSQILCPQSYISFGNILAQNLIIGTVPQYVVTAVKVGKKRVYQNDFATVVHLGIKRDLFFGFEWKNGVAKATPEKAVLDTLYFHQLGHKWFFDVYGDVNYSSLDKSRTRQMLKKYKNPAFVSFAKGLINGKYQFK